MWRTSRPQIPPHQPIRTLTPVALHYTQSKAVQLRSLPIPCCAQLHSQLMFPQSPAGTPRCPHRHALAQSRNQLISRCGLMRHSGTAHFSSLPRLRKDAPCAAGDWRPIWKMCDCTGTFLLFSILPETCAGLWVMVVWSACVARLVRKNIL